MTKTNNQFNSLFQSKFVQDIDQKTAANYSGGVGRINGAANDPDIILYEDLDFRGQSIGINAAVGDGIPNVGASFNDKTSSVKVIRGTWELFEDDQYRGLSGRVTPGGFDTRDNPTGDAQDNILTSLKRIG